MDCINDIIGLTRTTCECYAPESGYDASESGFYLDELEGLNLITIDKSQDCATGNVWDMLSNARTLAINDFKGDVMASISKNHKLAMATYSGTIGKTRWDGTKTVAKTYSGITLMPKRTQQGVMAISKIHLAVNSPGEYTGYLYSSDQNENDDPIETFTITALAQRWAESETLTWELPMVSEDGGDIAYYIVIDNQGNKVMDNRIACCGFSPNCKVFGNETQKERIWYNYVKIGGVVGNSLTELQDCTPSANLLYGMKVTTAIRCDAADVICDNVDFSGNGNAMVIAKSIQYKGGFHIASMILSSTDINRYTMLDREELYAKRDSYQREYQNRIEWLGENMNVVMNGCWQCEQRVQIIRL